MQILMDEEKVIRQKEVAVPVGEKYTLTIKEAAAYFNIGTKKMRILGMTSRASVRAV